MTGSAGLPLEDPAQPKYDAFMSYSKPDEGLAATLQTEVQRLGKPWNRRRLLHVFRDQTSLSAGPRLWVPIESALRDSSHLVLIASPSSAQSGWVSRELDWWLEHRGPERIILVVSGGDLVWDEGRRAFDAERSTCLPTNALTCFAEEPLWIDVRAVSPDASRLNLEPAAASIVAGITGKDKDEIIGEDLRQHRRAKRLAFIATGLIAILALVSGAAAVSAFHERKQALAQRDVSESRALAASSQVNLVNGLNHSMTLALLSNALHDDVYSQSAIFRSLALDPHLVMFSATLGSIDQMAWIGNTHTIAMGGRNFLETLDVTDKSRVNIAYKGRISALGSSAAGDELVIGSYDGSVAAYSVPSGDLVTLRTPFPGSPIVAVTVDASGQRVACLSKSGKVAILSLTGGAVQRRDLGRGSDIEAPSYISFTESGTGLVVGNPEGQSEVLDTAHLSVESDWTPVVSADARVPYAYVSTPGAVIFSYPDHGRYVLDNLYGTADESTFDGASVQNPSSYTLSPTLRSAAVDDNGVLVVTNAKDSVHPQGSKVLLRGAPSVGVHLGFSSDGRLLASAHVNTVSIWAPETLGGIAAGLPDFVPSPRPGDAFSPTAFDPETGHLVFLEQGVDDAQRPAGYRIDCWNTRNRQLVSTLPVPGDFTPGPMTWSDDRRKLILGAGPAGTGSPSTARILAWTVDGGCPVGMPETVALPGRSPGTDRIAVQATRDGNLVVLDGGNVRLVSSDGTIVHDFGFPVQEKANSATAIAVSPSGDEVIIGFESGALKKFTLSGSIAEMPWHHTLRGGSIGYIVYCNPGTIAASNGQGIVTLVPTLADGRPIRLSGAQAFSLAVVGSGAMLLGAKPDNQAVLWDLATKSLMAAFTFAPLTLDNKSPLLKGSPNSALDVSMVSDGARGIWFVIPGSKPTWWTFDPATWHAVACNQAGSLSHAEELAQTLGLSSHPVIEC